MRRLKLTIGSATLLAQIYDTPTADAVCAALPLVGRAAIWGREIYFPSYLAVTREADARSVLEAGELACRIQDGTIEVAWGPTPASEGDEIRLASEANIWGKAIDDVSRLAVVEAGADVRLDLIDQSP